MFKNIINFIKSEPAITISLISLCLSIYNFMYNLICKKCKIQIVIHEHLQHFSTHTFFITFQNCSQLPISISNVVLNNHYKKSYSCVLEPVLVKELTRRSGNTITDRISTYSIKFPINLSCLESYSGYIEFRNVDTFNKDDFSFSLFTNRKAIKNVATITNDDLAKKL